MTKCVVPVPSDSQFSLQNLPFGVFRNAASQGNELSAAPPRVGVAIGDYVIDMAAMADAGCFSACDAIRDKQCFQQVRGLALLCAYCL